MTPTDVNAAPPDDIIICRDVHKWYDGFHAVRGVTTYVKRGEVVIIIGPSGSGKSTFIRTINRLERHERGQIIVDGIPLTDDVRNIDAVRRHVGMVAQSFNLFPHMSALSNITLAPTKVRKLSKQDAIDEAMHLLDRVNLEGYAARYPHQLSGGQQQRVALARALAPAPDLILMDEPFSSLDAGLRGQLRAEVRAILKERGATVICVTHDQEEAMQLADRMAVMNEGRIEQLGSPEQVFNYPDTRFAAEFFGTADFLPAWRDGAYLTSEVGRIPWSEAWATPSRTDDELQVMVRPDCLDMEPEEEGNGVVVQREFLGAFNLYSVGLDSGRRVQVMQSHLARFDPGTRVRTFLREGHQPLPFIDGQALVDEPAYATEPDSS
ncbi:General L-amino acid transport ATP-binding protein AapP [Geodia barretti]|uniref:General L-amino acid transport ATP-binding protein AapP n=1 Tax=Geodia barretti TaxID=519541 RepID=A0AA35T3H2_GEOBA|nr:General L-amino acid transport ATP-binding protein AapP [Geodia barretti]